MPSKKKAKTVGEFVVENLSKLTMEQIARHLGKRFVAPSDFRCKEPYVDHLASKEEPVVEEEVAEEAEEAEVASDAKSPTWR